MSGVACVFKGSEIDVRDALVRLHDDPDADVAVLLVLSVKGVPDDIVAGFGMKGTDAQDFVWSGSAAHLKKPKI